MTHKIDGGKLTLRSLLSRAAQAKKQALLIAVALARHFAGATFGVGSKVGKFVKQVLVDKGAGNIQSAGIGVAGHLLCPTESHVCESSPL